jgi:hypothetical protein
MRGVWAIAAACVCVVACGFRPGTGGGPDGELSREDAPPGTLLWRMDSTVELGVGATLADAVVHPRGVVEPEAFATGVLRLRSSNDQLWGNDDEASWSDVETVTPVRTGLGLPLPIDRGVLPGGLGIDNGNWTMWGDGEIYLESGVTGFALRADDAGFIDIFDPALADFRRVVGATYSDGVPVTGDFDAPSAGWYPIRVGLSQGNGPWFFDLQIDPPGGAPIVQMNSGRFRAAVNEMTGPLITAADEPYGIRIAGQAVGTAPMIDEDWDLGAPSDMGLVGSPPDNFSMRYEGQIRIDVGGAYAFTLDTDDGHRFAVDGQLLSESWTIGTPMITTAPLDLAPGWHDVVLDFFDAGGAARVSLVVASAPEAALVGAALPLDRIRPVTGFRERALPSTMVIRTPIVADADVDLVLALPGAGTRVSRVDIGIVASHPTNWGDVEIRLTPPGGSEITFYGDESNAPPGSTTGAWIYDALVPSLADNWTVAGTWRLRFDDDSGANESVLYEYHLTPHFDGGPDVVEHLATWTSVIHGFGEVVRIDNVNWSAQAPPAGDPMVGVDIEIRTCMAPCTDEAWVPVPTPGSAPVADFGSYAQVRAVFRSNGIEATWLDWVDVLAVPP